MQNSIVSVSQAAELVRRDRQTLYNHRKQGKLSFVRRSDGSFGVDTAELHRVYGKLYVTAAEIKENEHSAAVAEVRHKLELCEMELKHAKETSERLRDDVQSWKARATEAAASVKLLEHQQSELSEQANKAEEEWKLALFERKDEIRQAKAEAAELRQRERDQAETLQAERAKVAALESRGIFARLFNKKPASVG